MNQKKRKEHRIDRYNKQTSPKESDRSIDIIVRKKRKNKFTYEDNISIFI